MCVIHAEMHAQEQAYKDLLRLHGRKRFRCREDLSRPFRYILLKSEIFGTEDRRGNVGQLITPCIVCLYLLTVLPHGFP